MTHIPAAPAAVDYLLLTPGPLSTTATVRAAMLQDSCTWDADYNLGVVEPIRRELVRLATGPEYESDYSAVLLQGSGSYNIAEKQYTAQAGDVLFFNSGVLHDETAVEDRDIVTLCIAVQGLELHGCRRNALLPENIAPLVHLGEDFSIEGISI